MKKSTGYTEHEKLLMLVIGGLMMAVEIVLERYLAIYESSYTRFTFAFVARVITGFLFGPLYSGLIGFSADFIGATIKYGSPNIFLGLAALLRGFIYGLFLHKKFNIRKAVAASVTVELLIGLLLNTFILKQMNNIPFKETLIARIPQTVIYIAFEIPLIIVFSKFLIPQLKRIISGYMDQGRSAELVSGMITPGSIPGLDRVSSFSKVLGSPEQKLKFIHVAGTNGKGSISNMIAEILRASGLKVGVFNSPYLSSPREYFKINGKLISKAGFAELTSSLTDKMKAAIGNELSVAPTEFEFYVCGAIKYFADNDCDIVVLEAGMGGKDDATNYIKAPELAVITNIAMDHEKYLGDTLKSIAGHKSGIIKKGSDVVLYPSAQEALSVLNEKCREAGIEPRIADFSRLNAYSVFGNEYSTVVNYTTSDNNRYEILIKSPALYQARNAAVALEAVDVLKKRGFIISEDNVIRGFEYFNLPARFEILSKAPLVIADGGHNPQCMLAVTETLATVAHEKKVYVLTDVMKDKAYEQMFDILDPYVHEYITVTADNNRALDAEELAAFLGRYNKNVVHADTVYNGVTMALDRLEKDDCLLVTGTFYMMDSVRRTIKSKLK